MVVPPGEDNSDVIVVKKVCVVVVWICFTLDRTHDFKTWENCQYGESIQRNLELLIACIHRTSLNNMSALSHAVYRITLHPWSQVRYSIFGWFLTNIIFSWFFGVWQKKIRFQKMDTINSSYLLTNMPTISYSSRRTTCKFSNCNFDFVCCSSGVRSIKKTKNQRFIFPLCACVCT